ncbi:MAG: lytic transglycosylase domain-containing protein [Caldimicrobium sp.]
MKSLKWILIILFVCIIYFSIFLKAQEVEDLFSEYIENVEILPSEIVKHLPMDVNAQIAYFIKYYTTEKREVVERWFRRCGPLLPYFRIIFKEEGLPEDLIYLALVESGCNPFAVSPAKAVGIWQFIETTAKNYGLKIDFWIDERRDFIKSTYAAAKYLKKLYEIFGDWRLAIASYNAGEGRVSRALKAKNFVDYWRLMMSGAIPYETFAYLPQWLAISAIAKNPQKYNFEPIKEDPLDYVEVEVLGGLDLRALALAAEANWETFRMLNAELRRDFTPPNRTYLIKIPFASKMRFLENLAHLELKEIKTNTPEGDVLLYVLDEDKTYASFNEKTNEDKKDGKKNFNENRAKDIFSNKKEKSTTKTGTSKKTGTTKKGLESNNTSKTNKTSTRKK